MIREFKITFISCCALLLPMLSAAQELKPDRRFTEWDSDKDGKLTREELPERNRKNFGRVDTDKDGFISLREHLTFVGRLPRNRNQVRQPRALQGVKIEKNIAYAGTDNPRQALDLALPEKRATDRPLAVIAYIHGGGWRQGSKDGGLNRLGAYLATGRYAGVSIGYRLSGEAKWPQQLYDCKAAIRWLKANSKKYGLDPKRIAVYGTSAGGHLVAMLGVTGNNKELEGDLGPYKDYSGSVAAVLDYFGPTQFLLMNSKPSKIDHDAPRSPESLLIGGAIQENKEKTLHAAPMSYISKKACPFLIVHGTKDMAVPFHQSEILDKALDKLEVESILIRVEGGGHGVRGTPLDKLGLAFLEKHFWDKEVKLADETIQDSELRPQRREKSSK
ncbi:MAG: alpha/beta hydrolase fold domain-containing protein [Planctomycetota bacterium]|nr:alpha/beta hydrolase fold domain-containing protein [Planctomycetota bacterium]